MKDIKNNKEEVPFAHYLNLYGQIDPIKTAQRCGVKYDEEQKCFQIRCMGEEYYISYPAFKVEPVNPENKNSYLINSVPAHILFIRYLIEGSNSLMTGKFLSYRDFPWGEVYFTNFKGRCIMRLTGTFGKRPEAFKAAMERIGAVSIQESDWGYQFEFINNLYIRFLLWEGDEEFPPSMQILFSDNFETAFSAEDMAVVGDVTISYIK